MKKEIMQEEKMKEEKVAATKVAAIRKFNLEGVLENTDNTPIADGVEVKLTDRSTTVSRIEKSAEEPVKESVGDKKESVFFHVGDIVTLCNNEYTRSNYGGFVGELFHVEVAQDYWTPNYTLHHLESKIRILVAQENIKMIDAFSNYSVIDREDSKEEVKEEDAVKHPSYYTFGKYEVIDVIEDWKLPFHLANVIKYIARAGKKLPDKEIEDLQKASFYLNRYIEYKKKN